MLKILRSISTAGSTHKAREVIITYLRLRMCMAESLARQKHLPKQADSILRRNSGSREFLTSRTCWIARANATRVTWPESPETTPLSIVAIPVSTENVFEFERQGTKRDHHGTRKDGACKHPP